MGKVYHVIRRQKATGSLKTAKRVIQCDCGRMVAVNKKGEVTRHAAGSIYGDQCPLSWRKVQIRE
jgi:hypothetical protein